MTNDANMFAVTRRKFGGKCGAMSNGAVNFPYCLDHQKLKISPFVPTMVVLHSVTKLSKTETS